MIFPSVDVGFLGHARKVSLATILTIAAVGGLEVAQFSSGSWAFSGLAYFVIPALVAVAMFRTWKQRATAFVLLTLAGFLASAAAISIYLTH